MCIEILHGSPDMDILVKYVFELRRTCPNYQWKKVSPAYCHFNAIKVWANAIHMWASAIKVWANAIKIQDQHKKIVLGNW